MKRTATWWVGASVVVIGCGAGPERRPEPTVAAPPDVVAPAGPCVAVSEDEARIEALATATDVRFCVVEVADTEAGEDALARTCWTVDLATGALVDGGVVPQIPEHAPAFVAEVDIDAGAIRVCPRGGEQAEQCTRFTPKLRRGETVRAAASDDTQTRLAWVVEDDAGLAEVVVAPIAKRRLGAPTARFTPREGARCVAPQWVDRALYVATRECLERTAVGALFDEKGKKLSDIGAAPGAPEGDGAPFDVDGHAPLPLGGGLWAFLDAAGRHVAIHDVASGARVRRIDLDTASGAAPRGDGPGVAGFARTPAGELVVVSTTPEHVLVHVVQPATGAVRKAAEGRACAR